MNRRGRVVWNSFYLKKIVWDCVAFSWSCCWQIGLWLHFGSTLSEIMVWVWVWVRVVSAFNTGMFGFFNVSHVGVFNRRVGRRAFRDSRDRLFYFSWCWVRRRRCWFFIVFRKQGPHFQAGCLAHWKWMFRQCCRRCCFPVKRSMKDSWRRDDLSRGNCGKWFQGSFVSSGPRRSSLSRHVDCCEILNTTRRIFSLSKE